MATINQGECRCPPQRSLGERYSAALQSDPLKTKTATSFILSGISAIISKYYQSGGVITQDIFLTALRMAALSCPPYSHFWYPVLETVSKNPVIKTIVDQLFWKPLIIAYSFVLMNLLKGKSVKEIAGIMRESYASTVKNAWKIWPAAQLLNQLVVPLHMRTVSMDAVSFFWDMYMTVALSQDAPRPQEPPAPGVAAEDDGAEDAGVETKEN